MIEYLPSSQWWKVRNFEKVIKNCSLFKFLSKITWNVSPDFPIRSQQCSPFYYYGYRSIDKTLLTIKHQF